MRESSFWANIKARVKTGEMPGKWQRVEVKYPDGFPDTICQHGLLTYFVELKAVDKVNELKHELRPEQAVWHWRAQMDGFNTFVLAWIGEWGREAWFEDTLAIRKGIFKEIPCPLTANRVRGNGVHL